MLLLPFFAAWKFVEIWHSTWTTAWKSRQTFIYICFKTNSKLSIISAKLTYSFFLGRNFSFSLTNVSCSFHICLFSSSAEVGECKSINGLKFRWKWPCLRCVEWSHLDRLGHAYFVHSLWCVRALSRTFFHYFSLLSFAILTMSLYSLFYIYFFLLLPYFLKWMALPSGYLQMVFHSLATT